MVDLWLEKEIEALRKKPRSYLHFDHKSISEKVKKQVRKISNPEWVRNHGFMPFLGKTLVNSRIKKIIDQETGQKRRFHDKKERKIHFASHLDSLIYSWYAFKLQSEYEDFLKLKAFSPSILAYRSLGKSNVHFAKDAFDFISKSPVDLVVMGFDVKSFFDNLNHQILLNNWKEVSGKKRLSIDEFKIYRSITTFSTVDSIKLRETLEERLGRAEFLKNKRKGVLCTPDQFREIVRGDGLIYKNTEGRGIPQGSAISALLSNVYMIHFDASLFELAERFGAMYLRYSDDILVICKPENEEEFKNEVAAQIVKLGLELSHEKTDITYFKKNGSASQGFRNNDHTEQKRMQYLGFEFDGQIALLRSSSMSRYKRKMVKGTRRAIYNFERALKNSEGYEFLSREEKQQAFIDGKVFSRKLIKRYSHLGNPMKSAKARGIVSMGNFVSYAYRSSEILDEKAIRRQLRLNLEILKETIALKKKQILLKRERNAASRRKRRFVFRGRKPKR